MAKRKTRVLPARKSIARRDDDSLLIKSAESFGRVIGSLQRSIRSKAADTQKRVARKVASMKK